jgi:hypothetical protein
VRYLSVLPIVALAVLALNLACGAPVREVSPGSPDAQATDVRRTAVANVQRIISNPSTPTPLPEPTSTPTPTCRDALWWTEARAHVGESRTVQGTIVGIRLASSGQTLLEIGQPYPDPTGLAVLLASGDATALSGKTVCVAGRIALTEGRPMLQVQSPSAISVVD